MLKDNDRTIAQNDFASGPAWSDTFIEASDLVCVLIVDHVRFHCGAAFLLLT